MNEVNTLKLYRSGSVWVYDDKGISPNGESFTRKSEVLVPSITAMIDGILMHNNEDPSDHFEGLDIIFSEHQLDNTHAVLKLLNSKVINNVNCGQDYELTHIGVGYKLCELKEGFVGFLCPALLDYFSSPPKNLYCQFPILNKPPEFHLA